MQASELLTNLHRQGFTLTPLPGGKLEVRPASKLPEKLRQELRQHKPELLVLLEAVAWLRSKLSTSQRIAPLIAEWAGERDGSTGRWIDDLMQARWLLGVVAYVGEDGRFWWQLPQATVQ
jgi:hypothetical protein